jgi:hypothetical protein
MVGGAVAHPAATPEPRVRALRLRSEQAFPLAWLLAMWVIITGSVCRERGRGSVREASEGCQRRCWRGSRRGDALPSTLGWVAKASMSKEPGAGNNLSFGQGRRTTRRDLCGGCRVTGSPTAMAAP